MVDSQNECVTCYADDTKLLAGGENFQELSILGTNLFDKTTKWFLENKLILNADKTSITIKSNNTRRFTGG